MARPAEAHGAQAAGLARPGRPEGLHSV